MEHQSTTRKKNRSPLYMVLAFLSVFALFVYGITRPSKQGAAIRELQSCFHPADVKACWDKFRMDLYQDEEFIFAIRKKLTELVLSKTELEECRSWLPPPQKSLNLIIVPDLSKRIIDNVNNPDQITNDTVLLNTIWNSFVAVTRAGMNTRHRLMIDVTDEGQAGGQFRLLANSLIFDLSTHKNKSNRLYFDSVKNRFSDNIVRLYDLARKQPIGADFWYYFNRNLGKRMLKPTLFEDYRNVLIILTDGYLEAQTSHRTGIALYTGTHKERALACEQIKKGMPVQVAVDRRLLAIRDCQQHFPDLEVLVLEVNERRFKSKQEPLDQGTACDFDILKKMWADWFDTLEIRNANSNFFIQRNDATALTKNEITNFLVRQ